MLLEILSLLIISKGVPKPKDKRNTIVIEKRISGFL